MSRNRPSAAGAFIAFAVLAGAIVGVIKGQPTIGLFAGLAAGVAIAVVMWLRDRR